MAGFSFHVSEGKFVDSEPEDRGPRPDTLLPVSGAPDDGALVWAPRSYRFRGSGSRAPDFLRPRLPHVADFCRTRLVAHALSRIILRIATILPARPRRHKGWISA